MSTTETLRYVAKTMSGLEHILADEITACGGTEVEILPRAVAFEGDQATLYRVNLCARTALRVLKPLFQFKAHNEIVFYKRLRRYDWTQHLSLDKTFKINSSVHSDQFRHSKYIALKTKDAILDEFRRLHDGERPSIDVMQPDVLIDVHCTGIDFIVSLDSSGESLHRRGYRQSNRKAPLNEALAAGMIMLSDWDKKTPLLDPMCGSGTLLTEAYLYAHNIPPRIMREHFQFMDWSNFDEETWQKVKAEAIENISEEAVPIVGYDTNTEQIQETKALLSEMNIAEHIQIEEHDFFDQEAPFAEGMIIMNPPYGVRIVADDIDDFYKKIGDTLKQKYTGWSTWIISGNKDALKKIGLRTSTKLALFNGAIPCKYHRYDLYQGTKKATKLEAYTRNNK